jgi:hypothetical protein
MRARGRDDRMIALSLGRRKPFLTVLSCVSLATGAGKLQVQSRPLCAESDRQPFQGHINPSIHGSTRSPPRESLLRHVRHDLSHLHRLTWRQLLNAEHDLVIRCGGRILEQFPKALQ